jgi:hypothetical protein
MKLKSLFLIGIFIFSFQSTFGQSDSLKTNKKRFFIIGTSLSGVLVGSYWYIQNSWWSDKQIPFHFDDGADLTYALNVDKVGHFMGGLEATDIFSSSMKWAGMHEKKALWYGAVFGSGIQLAIEMKDAYAPYWGFSKWDLALGSAGSLWPVAQYYNDDLKAINFKFSYYKSSNTYWDLDKQRGKETNKYAWQDDYPNQTYWIAFDINHFRETCCWPEWYIALDYDIPKMLKSWDSPIGKKVKHWMNYFHLPAPTIRISPKLEFYPLFL